MKIVNLEKFRALPDGTIFTKYEPCCFDGFSSKEATTEHDFVYCDLIHDLECSGSEEFSNLCFIMEEQEVSTKTELDCTARDGMFDDNQLFAIYEKDDIENLISKLQSCLTNAYVT